MKPFIRDLSDTLIDKLKKEPLFTNRLLPDIKEGEKAVFPAIRNGSVAFYYKGGGIFTYSKDGFKTHIKYGFNPSNYDTKYIREKDIDRISVCHSFEEGYKSIKEHCEKYGGVEAETVSNLYSCSGANPDKNVILLDTEICFDAYDDSLQTPINKKNRIDLLLYDLKKKQLCFCEAKNFTNKELWAKEGSKPKVCTQINRYNKTLVERKDEIIQQYERYIEKFNYIFDTCLPFPDRLHLETGLLIFGFDINQKKRIKELLLEDGSLDGIKYYNTGELKAKQISTLYKVITK